MSKLPTSPRRAASISDETLRARLAKALERIENEVENIDGDMEGISSLRPVFDRISEAQALLAQTDEPKGPRLPWVSVDVRMPEFDEVVLWRIDGYFRPFAIGRVRKGGLWTINGQTAVRQHWKDLPTHWLPLSAIPLPTDSWWIDAGVGKVQVNVGGGYSVTISNVTGIELPSPRTYRVMVKPVESWG